MELAAGVGLRVLVVDDSAIIRSRLVRMIEESGHGAQVAEADNVPDAISLVARFEPKLVVLDINLPGGSGFDILAAIKRRTPSPCVIVLTNYAREPGYEARCRELGADFFLDKSMDFERVSGILDRIARSESTHDHSTEIPGPFTHIKEY